MTGFAYGAAAPVIDAMPSSGNRTSGTSAVAAMGIASEIHQMAMSVATAAVRQASTFIPDGGGTNNMSTQARPPAMRPIRFAWLVRAMRSSPAGAGARGVVGVVTARN